MKSKGFWSLVLVVALTSLYVFWDLKSEKDTAQKKDQESVILKLQKDQINELRIERTNDKIVLKRDTDGWKLIEPLKDWADNNATEDFISALLDEKSMEVANEGDNIDMKVYGLDQPKAKLTIQNQSGQSETIEISEKKNFEGNSLIHKAGTQKVLIASGVWFTRASKTALEFRDKRFLRAKIGSVDSIDIKNPKGSFKLVSKNGKWLAEDQPKWNIEQNRVRELLSGINETKVLDYTLEREPSKQERQEYGLVSPEVTLQLKMAEKNWRAELSEGKDKASYAFVSDPVYVLKLEPGQIGRFKKYEIDDFREKKSAFDFNKLLVKKIELKNNLKTQTFNLIGEQWEASEKSKDFSEDQEKIRSLVDHLHDSTVYRYAKEKEAKNFQKSEHSVVLKDADGKVLFELVWGGETKSKIDGLDKTLSLAKTNKLNEVFWLDEVALNHLQLNSLMKKNAKPSPVQDETQKKAEKE